MNCRDVERSLIEHEKSGAAAITGTGSRARIDVQPMR